MYIWYLHDIPVFNVSNLSREDFPWSVAELVHQVLLEAPLGTLVGNPYYVRKAKVKHLQV